MWSTSAYLGVRHSCMSLVRIASKFDTKTLECILLGYVYDAKGYMFFDPEARKVHVSRDVMFDESHLHCINYEARDVCGSSGRCGSSEVACSRGG